MAAACGDGDGALRAAADVQGVSVEVREGGSATQEGAQLAEAGDGGLVSGEQGGGEDEEEHQEGVQSYVRPLRSFVSNVAAALGQGAVSVMGVPEQQAVVYDGGAPEFGPERVQVPEFGLECTQVPELGLERMQVSEMGLERAQVSGEGPPRLPTEQGHAGVSDMAAALDQGGASGQGGQRAVRVGADTAGAALAGTHTTGAETVRALSDTGQSQAGVPLRNNHHHHQPLSTLAGVRPRQAADQGGRAGSGTAGVNYTQQEVHARPPGEPRARWQGSDSDHRDQQPPSQHSKRAHTIALSRAQYAKLLAGVLCRRSESLWAGEDSTDGVQ